MYLKSLELQGFKSFPDKTALRFEPGITSIVGPNGSGKSNIADAIRWVLGEQSSKTLRGSKMEDVIFGGTQIRGPVGYAEVSLILDNLAGFLPIDAAEVMVTRRFYRSGDSEYYINRTSVRLRDIHELFMDTGLGRDGYSIIGQGRIDEILSVRSEDRREIFEEAAGISKYRYRKEESERKLSGTEGNLLRINDKVTELELSVAPLREQSEKARQYLTCRDELRVLEVSLWLDQLQKLQKGAAEYREAFGIVSGQLREEKAALDKLYADSEAISEKIHARDIELEQRRAGLEEEDQRLARLDSEVAVLETSLANLTENLARLLRENDEHVQRTRSLEDQIGDAKRRAEHLEGEISENQRALDALEEESRSLVQSASDLTGKADAMLALVAGEESELTALRLRQRAAETSSEELLRRSRELRADQDEREAEYNRLIAETVALKQSVDTEKEQVDSLKNVIDGYEYRLSNRKKKLDLLREAINKLQLDRSAQKTRLKLLSDMERDYEGFPSAVKLLMQESGRGTLAGIRGPISKLIKTDEQYTLAIETALGGALQNIVTETDRHAKSAIEWLKRRDGGRATFLPISAIRGRTLTENLTGAPGLIGLASELVRTEPDYLEILNNLLGRVVIMETLDHAIELARKHDHRFRIVTLDGQVVNPGGSMTGGSSGRNTGILSRANELEQLRIRVAELEQVARRQEEELLEATREVHAAEYEAEVAKAEKRRADDALLTLNGELKKAGSNAEMARKAMDLLQSELEKILARQLENGEIENALAREIEVHMAERDRLQQAYEELKSGKTDLTDRSGQLTERAQRYREAMSGAQSELQAIGKNTEELERLQKNFSSDRERREELIGDYRKKEQSIAEALGEKTGQASALRFRNEEERKRIAAVQAARMEFEGERSAVDRRGKEKNQTILQLQQEESRLEAKKNECDQNEKQILDKLWENYELTRTTAEAVSAPLSSISASNKRVAELKREMSKLGDVNLGSIEEYKRVSERYEYLTTQREDIEKSRQELINIIGEITRQMKSIFAERFEQINRSFTETFSEIFGGGSAHLELEDDDILNCGIEIIVQPPGKAIKSITLLSGGEKAFVAIALYFSILKVRPTPFCVLDEIEAALDDVNVERYAKYLRKLCGTTQFILITHRRGTMEESDILYGVTMQSSGISKVLTLNINEAERELGIQLK